MKIPMVCAALLLPLSMSCGPEIGEDWLDGPGSDDACLDDPTCLVSNRSDVPHDAPVVVAVHGFSASTFEMQELADAFEPEGIAVSRVLMGGHGRDLEDWKQTDPKAWFAPALKEYRALVDQGYTNISFATASLGGTLLLNNVADGAFNDLPSPRQMLLVDPLVEPVDQSIYQLPWAIFVTNDYHDELTDEERRHWYSNWPREVLLGLLDTIETIKANLEDNITLPDGTAGKLYISKVDEAVDPRSPGMLVDGVKHEDGSAIARENFDGRYHVFVRGAARDSFNDDDKAEQAAAFADMIERLKPTP